MKIYTGYPGGITKITNDKGFYQTEDLANVISVYVNQADVTGITYTLALEFLRADGRKTTIYTEESFASGEATTLTEDNVTYDIHNFTLTNTQLAVAGALAFTCYINILNSGVVEKRGVLFNAVSNVRKTVTYSANTIFVVSDDDEDVPIIVADMKTAIETLSNQLAGKVNKADVADNLTTNDSDKVLSAKQGKVLKDTIDGVQEELDSIQALENLNNIVGTYAELEALITIGEATEYQLNAKVQVLNDSTHDNNSTLYNLDSLDIINGLVDNYTWRFVGYYDGYNKEKIDEIINDFEQSVTDNFNELSGQLEVALTEQDEKIEELGTLQPSGADTTEHITNKTAPDGIWISTTDGHWYYWDGTQYVDGGVYQATELPSDVLKHDGNQLKDKDGNNIYPKIDETKINLLDAEVDGIFVLSKNILDMDNITRTEGKYLNISNGNESTNSSYFYTNDYIPVEPNTTYYVNSWKKSDNTQLNMIILGCLYDEHKTYISGFNGNEFTTPSNCYFLRFSTVIDAYNYRHISISKTQLDNFVPYYKLIKNDLAEEKITIKCASSGTADFRNLRKCLESITDASEDRQYVVELAEGTYDFTNDITAEELADSTFKGIFVPNFVTIKGIGNKENTIIQLTLSTQNNNVSTLNMMNTSGLENLTIKGINTRYVIHDDFTDGVSSVYYRYLKNVIIKGDTCSLSSCYGCGAHSGMIAKFENCIFDGTNVLTLGGNGIPFLIHNNVEWDRSVHFTFENCRFLTIGNLPDNVGSSRGGLLLRTLQHAYNNTSRIANMFVYVTIKGCELNDIVFREENATYYGTGCMFKVNGYGNKNDDYRIYTTDGVDYSSYVDLI